MNTASSYNSWVSIAIYALPFVFTFAMIQWSISKGIDGIKSTYEIEIIKYVLVILLFIGIFSFYGPGDNSAMADNHSDNGHYHNNVTYTPEKPQPKAEVKPKVLTKQNTSSFKEEKDEADAYIKNAIKEAK
jgi:hypothetical protein